MSSLKQILGKGLDKFSSFLSNAGKTLGGFSEKLKNFKVTVKIKNSVNSKDPLKKISLLACKTWSNLFEARDTCKITDIAKDEKIDLTFLIKVQDSNLIVEVQSEYLDKQAKENEILDELKDALEEANKFIDKVLERDRSLKIETEKLLSANETQKVLILNSFFEKKLLKLYNAVLIRKLASKSIK